jgi:hypothetical protein
MDMSPKPTKFVETSESFREMMLNVAFSVFAL